MLKGEGERPDWGTGSGRLPRSEGYKIVVYNKRPVRKGWVTTPRAMGCRECRGGGKRRGVVSKEEGGS